MEFKNIISAIEEEFCLKILSLPELASPPESFNKTYHCFTSKGEIAMRISNNIRKENDIWFEHTLLRTLFNTFPFVPRLLYNKKKVNTSYFRGSWIRIDGKFITLFHWIETLPFEGSKINIESSGEFIGKLFYFLDRIKIIKPVKERPTLPKVFSKRLYSNLTNNKIERITKLLPDEDVIHQLRNWESENDDLSDCILKNRYAFEEADSVIVHLDVAPHNLGYNEKGEANIIWDFDNARYGSRYYDLGWTLLSFSIVGGVIDYDRLEKFVRAMSIVYDLSNFGIKEIFLAMRGRVFLSANKSINNWKEMGIDYNDMRLRENILMYKQLKERYIGIRETLKKSLKRNG